mgnify:CR=1 FL=1
MAAARDSSKVFNGVLYRRPAGEPPTGERKSRPAADVLKLAEQYR